MLLIRLSPLVIEFPLLYYAGRVYPELVPAAFPAAASGAPRPAPPGGAGAGCGALGLLSPERGRFGTGGA
jgi:hypothetical protein